MDASVQKEWLSVTEVQEVLGIGRTKAYRLITSGEIPAVRIGRLLRINRAELDTWAKGNRYRPGASSSAELDGRTAKPKR